MTQDVRLEQLRDWVHTLTGWQSATLEPASADASFRRYFRASQSGRTAIVMDAPPEKENSAPFIDVTSRLIDAEVAAPNIFAQNLIDGLILLEDLGSTPLLNKLSPETADFYYQLAMQELLKLQLASSHSLPVYTDKLLRQEMELMPEWFLGTHLQFVPDDLPGELITQTFDSLAAAVLEQPVTFVHRDYHSRNLMITPDDTLGVIDYQDAVLGPATYDLVSLLRDCYVVWPEQRIINWVKSFHKRAIAAGNIPPVDELSLIHI